MSEETENIDHRVTTVETDLKHVVKGLTSLEKTVNTIAQSIEDITKKMASVGTINLQSIIAIFSCVGLWSGILAGLLGLYVSMSINPLRDNIENLTTSQQHIYENAKNIARHEYAIMDDKRNTEDN